MTTTRAASTTYQHILYEVKDRIAIITLNRPEQLNALSRLMREEIGAALRQAENDPEVGCIVITGAGRAFSSGADLKERPVSTIEADGSRHISKVLVVAVNGMCFGAAMMWTVQQDIIIASDQARFCLIETRFGASGGPFTPFHVGPQWAKMLVCAGEEITAKTARRIGLIADVVPHNQFMPRALDLAHRIATMPRKAVIANKSEIDGAMDMMGWSNTKALRARIRPMRQALRTSEDATTPEGRPFSDIREKEGMRAFVAARDIAWGTRWTTDD